MSEPIRVLHVVSSMGMGGIQNYIMNIYRSIDKDKVQFDFVEHSVTENVFDNEIISNGGLIFLCPRYTGRNHFVYCKWWDDFFSEHSEYHIVHGHIRSTAAIYFRIAKQHGLVTIAHSHSTSNGRGFSAIVKNTLQLPIRYMADYLFACSDKAGMWLFGEKATKRPNYKMIPNGVDLERFAFDEGKRCQMRNELRIDENTFVLGHIGRITVPKNHKFLVELFAEYHKEKTNSKLLLVGDGELLEDVKHQIEQMSINDAVIMVGNKTNTEDYYQAMDVFVFPSLWEGLPVSVVEAQANGLPCLLSDAITRDVFLTDLVSYLSLDDRAAWSKEIKAVQSKGRGKISSKNIEKLQLFDSKKVAMDLQEFYLNSDRKGKE